MNTLTNTQREHLIMILDIQSKRIWNNGRNSQLKEILRNGEYDGKQQKDLNEMNDDYKAFCKHRKKSGDPNYTFWPKIRRTDAF